MCSGSIDQMAESSQVSALERRRKGGREGERERERKQKDLHCCNELKSISHPSHIFMLLCH